MVSTRKKMIVGAAFVALFGASQALAGAMVVRSTGPSAKTYPVGKSLPSDMKLTLKAGDLITVLDSGGTRVLKGPGVVAASGSSAASGTGFSQLIANTGAKQARTGATRAAIGGGPARSPNVWYVDATKNGNVCVADAAALSVWRPDMTAATSISITRLSDGKSVNLDYRAGQTVRAWPVAELPAVEGAQYKIADAAGKTPTMVKLTMIGSSPADIQAAAASLLEKGCSSQMDVLVEGTMQAGPAASN